MTPQEINDQLELLRLKELFMSDIKIRSKIRNFANSHIARRR